MLPEDLSDLSSWYSGAEINLANNNFEYVPSFPEKIADVNLSGNKITEVTTGGISTDILRGADFSRNGLTTFPASLFPGLYRLRLARNKLTTLDISTMRELVEELDVEDNADLSSVMGLSTLEIKTVKVSGTKLPVSLLPKAAFFLYINRMNYEIGEADLSEFKANVIYTGCPFRFESPDKFLIMDVTVTNISPDFGGYVIAVDSLLGCEFIRCEENSICVMQSGNFGKGLQNIFRSWI